MPVKQWKRAQVLGTRLHLIETATALFGERGFAGTPLEEVVQQAGLSRGAVYHHFKDKRALFDAVVDQLLLEVVDEVEHATVKRAVARGSEREADVLELFVEAFADEGRRRILSVDGPSVLGRERWSELMWSRLLEPLQRVVARGRVEPGKVKALTHLLFGAVQEAALLVGQESARGAPVSKAEVDSALGWLLERLLGRADPEA
jgi:AcrR family transcriptional regulator